LPKAKARVRTKIMGQSRRSQKPTLQVVWVYKASNIFSESKTNGAEVFLLLPLVFATELTIYKVLGIASIDRKLDPPQNR